MKTPNQIDRQRDDVQPDAEALLMVRLGAVLLCAVLLCLLGVDVVTERVTESSPPAQPCRACWL